MYHTLPNLIVHHSFSFDLFGFSYGFILKQTSSSLGIMIIEGKHAEVGQGIFISDIQEGSSAQKVPVYFFPF